MIGVAILTVVVACGVGSLVMMLGADAITHARERGDLTAAAIISLVGLALFIVGTLNVAYIIPATAAH